MAREYNDLANKILSGVLYSSREYRSNIRERLRAPSGAGPCFYGDDFVPSLDRLSLVRFAFPNSVPTIISASDESVPVYAESLEKLKLIFQRETTREIIK